MNYPDPEVIFQLTYSRRDNPFIMIGVHTNAVLFQVKGELAELAVFQLILV